MWSALCLLQRQLAWPGSHRPQHDRSVGMRASDDLVKNDRNACAQAVTVGSRRGARVLGEPAREANDRSESLVAAHSASIVQNTPSHARK